MKKIILASTAALALLASGTANAAVKDKPFFKVGGLVIVWGADDNASTANQNVVSDFYLLGASSGIADDLIGGATDIGGTGHDGVVVTGAFDPVTGEVGADGFADGGTTGVLDAGDSFSQFTLDNTTDVDGLIDPTVKGQFFVASNAAFNIQAKKTNVVESMGTLTMSNIKWAMDITETAGAGTDGELAFGTAAQLPGGATATAGVATIADLAGIGAADTLVFTGTQRTAESRGSIAEQSVRFNTSYTLDTDLTTTGNQGYDLSNGVGELSAEVIYTVYTP